jgi:hypothetical protein
MNGVWNAAAKIKAIDFAGGTVVHMSSGWSALVLCLILGKRKGFGQRAFLPHSLVLTMIGTGMLWVGWYGFNAGSAVAADGVAANAFMTTTLATAIACCVWPLLEWVTRGKPTILGFCSGAVAGLVVITPATGPEFVTTLPVRKFHGVGPATAAKMDRLGIKTGGGEFMITIVNDRTVDPLFGSSPSRFAIRARARMATIFFIQGVANKEFEFKPDVTVIQKGETLTGATSSVKNFTAGKIAKGQPVQGLVEMPKKLNLYEPFDVKIGGQTAEFRLSPDDVTDFGNK